MINISPSVNGNRPLGTHDNQGYSVNPVTGQPYAQNMVKSADYGRILAEFWADGPNSETPPGHWNVLANEVADSGLLDRKIGGEGRTVGALEWDVKMYLALNGAVHDAAIAAWGAKAEYDYVRPITMIRYQGSLGQSSNPNGPSYHPDGLPLEEGLIEVITADSIAQGGRHRNVYINANRDADGRFVEYYSESEMVGKIAIQSWNHEPADPDNQVSGVKWILAENWVPYQADNFVTPAFAAYVSGHSTFSRAAAEVLTHFTGSEYFPGGLGEQTFDVDYLDFEDGPTSPVTLQWATYYDAADEAGISRLWGGIHVPADDFAGRIMGAEIGIEAYEKATDEFVWDGLNWCNEVYTRDINNDGFVSPIDAQIVLNELDRPAYSSDGVLPDNSGKIPPYFFDVNDDGFVVPLDALLVINRLNEAAAGNGVFAIASVPEPSSVVLLSIAVLTLISRGRRTLN
ncbi:MAG: dockerin type I domain-containing protein [Pirellulaceae bacterium]